VSGPIFAVIAGVISSGKTTLAQQLAQYLEGDVYFEPVKENIYLGDFYAQIASINEHRARRTVSISDRLLAYLRHQADCTFPHGSPCFPITCSCGLEEAVQQAKDDEGHRDQFSRLAFSMQIYLLNKRFSQHQHIIWKKETDNRPAIQDRSIYEDSIFAEMLAKDGYMEPRDFETYLETFRSMSHFLQRPDIVLYLDVSPKTALERLQRRARPEEKTVSLEYLTALWEGYERWYADLRDTLHIVRLPWADFADVSHVARLIQNETAGRSAMPARWGQHF
jgi:deoxyadenosine/deoxycytidine kinase